MAPLQTNSGDKDLAPKYSEGTDLQQLPAAVYLVTQQLPAGKGDSETLWGQQEGITAKLSMLLLQIVFPIYLL